MITEHSCNDTISSDPDNKRWKPVKEKQLFKESSEVFKLKKLVLNMTDEFTFKEYSERKSWASIKIATRGLKSRMKQSL